MTKKKKVTKTVTVTEEVITSEKTQIICILDRSGSMSLNNIIVEARNGFNNFLKEQKKLSDEATITVALFDDSYDLLYDDVDINKVKKITEAEWSPRGTTALYDAIGKTINTARVNHKKKGVKKPDKVLVCIVTDGLENASHEYNSETIKKLIKKCEKDDWNFVYLAANQDAFDVGTSFGVSGGNTYTFAATMDGVNSMANVMNNASVSYRSMSKDSANYATLSKNLVGDEDENEVLNSTGTVTFTEPTTTVNTKDDDEK